MERYDLIAIGGGSAGLVTAAGAATIGLRAALVEREALIAPAKLAHAMRQADRLGLTGALIITYLLGASPHRLARWYPRQNA